MSTRLCLALTIACAACHSGSREESGSPATALSPGTNVTDDELQRFLNGMLVTSNVQPPNEPVWPIPGGGHPDMSTELYWFGDSFDTGWGFKTPQELRAYLETPLAEMGRSHAWALGKLSDTPTSVQVWRRMLEEDPDDLEAAVQTFEAVNWFDGPQAALDATAHTSAKTARLYDDRGGHYSPARLEGLRCSAFLRVNRLEEARKACNLATELDESFGQRTLAKVLLAMGKKKQALTQMEMVSKLPGRMYDFGALFTLGLAQQYNGLDAKARATWSVALQRWPDSPMLKKALDGPKRSVLAWEEDENAPTVAWEASWLGWCGHFYQELGMEERATACYRRADQILPGPALAHQLVFLGRTAPHDALERATAAAKTNPHVDLLTATGWLLFQQHKVEEAKGWVQRALQVAPYDPKAESLMWQICGEQKDYLCVIEYRKRLGLPTHFNVEQYRDVKRAWREQAVKNGEGLVAPEAPSGSVKPPPFARLELVPLGARVPPELPDAVTYLSAKFPSLKITVAPLEGIPPGTYKPEWRMVVWEHLLERLREEPGRLYVVEEDLTSYEKGFAFSRYDLAHGRGVISLARMRTLVGDPAPASFTADADVLDAIEGRLESELVRGVAKLVGVSFPCAEAGCAMHDRRSVADLWLGSPSFCPKHRQELREAMARQAKPAP